MIKKAEEEISAVLVGQAFIIFGEDREQDLMRIHEANSQKCIWFRGNINNGMRRVTPEESSRLEKVMYPKVMDYASELEKILKDNRVCNLLSKIRGSL